MIWSRHFQAGVLALAFLALPATAQDRMAAPDARAAALKGDVLLIDIRRPDEWRQTGVPDAARTLNMQDEKFGERLLSLIGDNPGVPVALICATGGRSGHVAGILAKNGMKVIDIAEGMLGSPAGPGWLKHGLPVRRPGEARVQDSR